VKSRLGPSEKRKLLQADYKEWLAASSDLSVAPPCRRAGGAINQTGRFRFNSVAPGKKRPQYTPTGRQPPREVGRPRRFPPTRGRREIRKFDGRNANHVLVVLKFDGEVHNWRRKGSRPEVPPMDPKNLGRATRYRQLALAEPDKAKAAILREIADEAERNVLCTVDKMDSSLRRAQPRQQRNLA
jgi:hypothetical protein